MENKLVKTGVICFWTAFVIELLIVMIDKSAYINPYQSQLFRITFLLFCIKAALTKYSHEELLCIILFGVMAIASYLTNGRDESVRAAVFVVSCKNMNLKMMLKITLVITLVGSIILFFLSAAGIFGAFSVTADFGRGTSSKIVETRYCFGMGHPNAFQTMLFMMSTVGIYLYASEMKLVHFLIIGVMNIAAYIFTDSNTGVIVMTAVVVGVLLLKYCKKLCESKVVYVLGAILIVFIVGFSAYGSHVGRDTPFMFRLDKILNGRFQYAHIVEAARIENWKLFGDAANQEYFDQGFIRLFYWYGIIVGIIYVLANIYLIWQSYKKKDYCLFVIVVGYAVLSIMEAHLISEFLLRNYLLIWLGYYWYQPLKEKNKPEGYFGLLFERMNGKAG